MVWARNKLKGVREHAGRDYHVERSTEDSGEGDLLIPGEVAGDINVPVHVGVDDINVSACEVDEVDDINAGADGDVIFIDDTIESGADVDDGADEGVLERMTNLCDSQKSHRVHN